jgi:hypothetical protein
MSNPSKVLVFGSVLTTLVLLFTSCREHTPVAIDLNKKPELPELFMEGLVSTALYERDIAISTTGEEIIFTRGTFNQGLRVLISISRVSGKWGPEKILPFSGKYQDIEPFLSPDDNTLYFASNRPVYGDTSRTDYNIWKVVRKEKGWGEPQPLDSLVNTAKDEFFPSVSANGNLYFTATRENGFGREDIFLSEYLNGNYRPPVPLDSLINSPAFEFNAYVNPQETMLVFSSYGREDGFGGGDLYFSKKNKDGIWSEAKNFGPGINTEYLDYCPFVDLKAGNFYFTSERFDNDMPGITKSDQIDSIALITLNGMGNIYRVSLQKTLLK